MGSITEFFIGFTWDYFCVRDVFMEGPAFHKKWYLPGNILVCLDVIRFFFTDAVLVYQELISI